MMSSSDISERVELLKTTEKPIRVLHVVAKMERAGLESRIMDIYRNIDRTKIQFDFLTHRIEDGDYDEEIKQLGGVVYHMPALKPWGIFAYLRRLKQFFEQHQEYRITHVHLNTYSGWVQYAALRAGVPVRITHSRNNGYDYDWKMPFKAMSKLIVNRPTTHKFACSHQAGEFLFGKKEILPPNEFQVIPNGFNLSHFSYDPAKRKEIRQTLQINNELAVVHVGRFSYPKNHFFLLEVFKHITEIRQDCKLFLLGEGELHEHIERKARALGLKDLVVFVGSVPNVGDYLNAMDLMVFPSRYEGFGTAVLETQCNGLPTLASDVLPKETKVSPCLEYMSLKLHASKEWAEKALEMYGRIERKDRTSEVRAAGYDIQDTYQLLSEFYLKHH